MKVSYDEDLANHIDPESCVCSRKVAGEALTGESAGQVLSRERGFAPGCRRRQLDRKATRNISPYGNREVLCLVVADGAAVRAVNPKGARQR